MPEACRVLFVDLDGTLVATDLMWESFLLAVKRDPWLLMRLPMWLVQGRAVAKARLAERACPDARLLPYREEVLELLRARKWGGWRIVLATAGDRRMAQEVADEIGLFDDILASDGRHNLKGPAKLAAIQRYCATHGYERFTYLGDSAADLHVWREADEAMAAAASAGTWSALESARPRARLLAPRGKGWQPLLRVVRPPQWAKNLLVFVPLLLAHELTDPVRWVAGLAALVAFSLCASGIYVFNDLLDIEADRRHPQKRLRPFAAGTLPVRIGPPLAAALVAGALGLSLAMLPPAFAATLVLYLVLNLLYTFWLKRKLMVDVLLLAALYGIRVWAGGLATEVPVSEWLMGFSLFLFTSLAFVKRYCELSRTADEGSESTPGRGYVVADLGLIGSIGPTSGYLAVLVMALYINSPQVSRLYDHPWALWLTCPLLLYWISRVWFLARRGKLVEDPVVFAFEDRTSWAVALAAAALIAVAA